MNLLKRELAPILPAAWEEIDEEARRVLELHLGARKLVDFDGPHGWSLAAVNLGRLELLDEHASNDGVHLGLRRVQPLIEARVPFELEQMELDCAARGARDAELGPLVAAAERAAAFENGLVFNGSEALGVTGIVEASVHDPIELPAEDEPERYPHQVVEAAERLRQDGINGPYALALGPRCYGAVAQAAEDGYPIRRRVEEIIEGPLVWVPTLHGAVLLSRRGGDFQLTVGQDLSIGYADHDRDKVELYITESCTFRVLEPAAAVVLVFAS